MDIKPSRGRVDPPPQSSTSDMLRGNQQQKMVIVKNGGKANKSKVKTDDVRFNDDK